MSIARRFFPNDKTNQDLAQALNLKLSSLFKIKTADEKIIFVYPPSSHHHSLKRIPLSRNPLSGSVPMFDSMPVLTKGKC